jgi:hypothetical protein
MNITRPWLLLVFATACSSAAPAPANEADATTAPPTYRDLFTMYFAPGTPGHCATAGCHADPGHNVWTCNDEESCYQGMIEVRLIDPDNPEQSDLIDEHRSPLTWINPNGGNMPLDAQGANELGRAAIEAWIAAGAPRD